MSYATGAIVKTYRGHTNTKYCSISSFVPWLPAGPAVASGSEDGGLFLWDVNSRQVCVWGGVGGLCFDSAVTCPPPP